MKILITGGAGYIGTHICVELLGEGHDVIVVDNLSNSSQVALDRVEEISGKSLEFHQVDLLDIDGLSAVFKETAIDAVIHLAGLKAVGESTEKPLDYYHNNITGSINLFRVMKERDVTSLVFSSSATVYGDPEIVPIKEDAPLSPTNAYGQTKLIIERILGDLVEAEDDWRVIILRYFNPVGAHPSGLIGESPLQPPNNLVPIISRVAMGKQEKLQVYGNDYPTPDGTGFRDYIHVVDLAKGHTKSLAKLGAINGLETYNLGTGTGFSVLEMIKAYERVNGVSIPYEVTKRRPGDIATCYADPSLAEKELSWKSELSLKAICRDEWRWISENPEGYQ